MKGYYGDGIQYYRKLRGMPPKALAAHLGMTRQNLSKIEQNCRIVSDERVGIAAKVLQTTPEAIKFHKKELLPNNNHEQGPQLIQAQQTVVGVLEATVKTLREALTSNDENHLMTQEALKKTRETLRQSYLRIAAIEAGLQ